LLHKSSSRDEKSFKKFEPLQKFILIKALRLKILANSLKNQFFTNFKKNKICHR
jgi:hypothetical protein